MMLAVIVVLVILLCVCLIGAAWDWREIWKMRHGEIE